VASVPGDRLVSQTRPDQELLSTDANREMVVKPSQERDRGNLGVVDEMFEPRTS
jgi:hypothetical protein